MRFHFRSILVLHLQTDAPPLDMLSHERMETSLERVRLRRSAIATTILEKLGLSVPAASPF